MTITSSSISLRPISERIFLFDHANPRSAHPPSLEPVSVSRLGTNKAWTRIESFSRDYTQAQDIASLAVRLLDAPDSADRVFCGAKGQPLVTPSEVADVVRTLILGASITIGAELGPKDEIELKYRGVISVENARSRLGWSPRFGNIRDGVEDYIKRYREYLNTQMSTH